MSEARARLAGPQQAQLSPAVHGSSRHAAFAGGGKRITPIPTTDAE
jgi:hypothetical protein